MTDTLSDNEDSVLSSEESGEDIDMPDIEEFDPAKFFTNKELCYYKMIDKFFKSCSMDKINKMLDIVNGTNGSEISLRVLDWFVTRYSKKKLEFDVNNNGETFDVHISYKSQLKSYRKKYFDPFRRRKKFWYKYDKNDDTKKFHTTLGQLNFFYWAISNNIIGFVEKNITQILKAMNQSNKEDKKKKEVKKKAKVAKEKVVSEKTIKDKDSKKINFDRDVNIKATKTVSNDEVQIVLSFD
jgi:hypothetical protein